MTTQSRNRSIKVWRRFVLCRGGRVSRFLKNQCVRGGGGGEGTGGGCKGEGGRALGWYMASPCCCCGRWWLVISVLSLSDRPDNQWALLDGAGAEPLTPPWSTPLPSAEACVCVCVFWCIHTPTNERHGESLFSSICKSASVQLQRETAQTRASVTLWSVDQWGLMPFKYLKSVYSSHQWDSRKPKTRNRPSLS